MKTVYACIHSEGEPGVYLQRCIFSNEPAALEYKQRCAKLHVEIDVVEMMVHDSLDELLTAANRSVMSNWEDYE